MMNRSKSALSIKALRLAAKLSRKEAAVLCGWTAKAFEQLENGRCNASEARERLIVAKFNFSWEEYLEIKKEPSKFIASSCERGKADQTVSRKPRRNEYKVISKESKVLRCIRRQKGLSQSQASQVCGLGPQAFTFMESGRVHLTEKKIDQILRALNYPKEEYKKLLESPTLPDEWMDRINKSLERLSLDTLQLVCGLVDRLV